MKAPYFRVTAPWITANPVDFNKFFSRHKPHRQGNFLMGLTIFFVRCLFPPALLLFILPAILITGCKLSSKAAPPKPNPDPGRAEQTDGRALSPNTRARLAAQAGITESRQNAIVRAVERATPSVVFIGVTQIRKVRSFINDPFFRQFFPPTYKKYESMGSGVIVDKTGLVVTNHHVIQGASEIKVKLFDGRVFLAEVIGDDPAVDLAILKIKGKKLPVMEMGSSKDLMLGEWAIAIGNPFSELISDSKPSVTVGVVSAVNREFKLETFLQEEISYRKMIQTDAAINPGNSGGALVNTLGKLIGINTFIFTKGGGSVGVGFSIPVERIKRILKEIREHGRIRQFWSGLTVHDIDRDLAQALGLEEMIGVIVNRVERGSPGKKAGIKRGDVILEVDGTTVKNASHIIDLLGDYYVNDQVPVKINRKGKLIKKTMILMELKKRRF